MRRRWDMFGMGLTGMLAGLLVGLLVAGVLPAGAATGAPLVLGEANGASKGTVMRTGGVRSLKIVNNRSTGTPLELVAQNGMPPLQVNSSGKVARLNVDMLDGLDSSELVTVFDYGPWIAAVASNGTLTRGSRVNSTSRSSAGVYVVTFDRTGTDCIYQATLDTAQSVAGDTITTAQSGVQIDVTVVNAAGTGKDAAFYLHMMCLPGDL
ncbi:hypothetical protein HQ535_00525 [bacterium]|nr:hypothetical protein [bacterium]